MKKLTCALLTIGLSLNTYSVLAETTYETPEDKSILTPIQSDVVEPDPMAKHKLLKKKSDVRKPLNPDKKMTNDKSDDKTKAERDEELKKEYEQNMNK
ncbi:MAG: hypothetical protein ABIP37_05510 [Methylotenera sp.]